MALFNLREVGRRQWGHGPFEQIRYAMETEPWPADLPALEALVLMQDNMRTAIAQLLASVPPGLVAPPQPR